MLLVEVEAIIQTPTVIAIIILAQDVIMEMVLEIAAQRQQRLIQIVVQMQIVVQTVLGIGLMITPIRHQVQIVRKAQQLTHLLHHHHGAEVHQAEVLVVVVREVQDNINKRLTRKIPSKATLRGFFRSHYRGIIIFNCHICSYVLILHHF